MKIKKILEILCLFLCISSLLACERGWISTKPPIHLNQNMDTQPKYKPYRKSEFFTDKKSMRLRESGTVARGELNSLNNRKPLVNENTLKRGKERYGIYCAPCHGENGDGRGTVAPFLMTQPTNLLEMKLQKNSAKHFFEVISNGIRSMPAYGHIIPIDDRWTIAFYILSLEKKQGNRLSNTDVE